MSELERIINRYLSKDDMAITYSNFNQEEVNKLFQNMRIYERPDILSMYDNKIVAIEHFEFDSYKNTRKGSNFKIQDNIIEKRMQNKIDKDLKKEKEIWIHDEIENTSSLQHYYNNFKKVLLTHIDNIPEYKEHIINDFGDKKDIEFWFFVEDVTPLGSYTYKREDAHLRLLLPFSKENLDTLRQHKEIKGIIFGIYAMSKYKLVLMYNDDATLDNLEKDEYFKIDDKDFVSFSPQTTGFATLIPKEEIGGETINE